MRKQKLFIFEFVSGGGYNTSSLPTALFCEGYSMLKSIIEDFYNQNFEIYTILDKRIAFLGRYLKANQIVLVDENCNYLEKYENMLLKTDACFIIAPEFSNILYELTEIATIYEKTIFSIGLEGIKLGTSKMRTYEFFKRSNIPTPETYLIPTLNNRLDLDFIYDKFHELNQSVIIKPEDGVGAELVLYINEKSQIDKLFGDNNVNLDSSRTYIIQRYIRGIDMSISLIGISDKNRQVEPCIFSVNTQNIYLPTGSIKSRYNGGMTPAVISRKTHNSLKKFLHKLDFSYFKGYFGIDFLLTPNDSIKFIEINPRLTTSYLGIRKIYTTNPLELLLRSRNKKIRKILPHPDYISEYYRLDLKYTGKETINLIREKITPKLLKEIPELITPPILLHKTHTDNYSCFIATKARDIATSKQQRNKIIEQLRNYDFIQLNGE